VLGLCHASTLLAEPDPADARRLDRMMVVGGADRAAEIPGSAAYISIEELERYETTDVNRALRRVPGLYLVEEEGYGLRPNIGIRGSGTDRNNRITVMEDGVLIAPAPYAGPAAYYFPTMARMSAVEVRKGSASIKSGPRTTGGAINLISTPIPDAPRALRGSLLFGEDSTVLGHLWGGGSSDTSGWLVETVQQDTDGFKQLDGGGSTGYQLSNYLAKFRLNSSPDAEGYQSIELKLGYTDQDSDETYMGLTNADFAQNPYRRYRGSQLDNIQTQHEQIQLSHHIEFGPRLDLTTVVYHNDFARNWFKTEQVGGQSLNSILTNPEQFATQLAWMRGADSAPGAFTLRNNNRSYYSAGIQSVLGWQVDIGGSQHQWEFGLRYHEDEEDRFQDQDSYTMIDGNLVLATDRAPGTQDNRVGEAEAWSFYVQDEISLGAWQFLPGLRYESVDFVRTDYVRSPDGRDQPPTAVRKNSDSAFIPGIGVAYHLTPELQWLGGIHRGYSPPSPGSTAEAEDSLNLEAGLRFDRGNLNAELIGYYNDYDNLVGTCTESSGGNCTIGDQFDGGEVRVYGIEAQLGYVVDELAGSGLSMPLRLAYTWTRGEFRNSFSSSFGEWGTVNSGDELPYLPEHQLFLEAALEGMDWSTAISANYADRTRTQAGSGPIEPASSTDRRWVLDLSAQYRINPTVALFGKIDNLLDEVYVTARRPSGARPGLPRTAYVGVQVEL
jgi:Fe(3+) dicitrate transport protein